MNIEEKKAMEKLAWKIRIDIFRQAVPSGAGHIGGSLSIAELMAVLYGGVMKTDPQNPKWEGRDYLILSKGHAGPALYAALAEKGFFPMDWLDQMNVNRAKLPSHADANVVPGVDLCTGSLGQGLAPAIGAAVALKADGKGNHVYCVLGDGEIQEGEVWEGIMSAPKFKVDNLTAFVDHNHGQVDGVTNEVMPNERLREKFEAFGWFTQTVNGHDVEAIASAIQVAKGQRETPGMIILETVKGYGTEEVSARPLNTIHHMGVTRELAEKVTAEFERRIAEI